MKSNLATTLSSDYSYDQAKSRHHLSLKLPILKKQIFESTLLFPSEAIIQKPLIPWINKLWENLYKITLEADQLNEATKLSAIYHQATHIFIFLNDLKSARELCYSQI